LEPRVDMAEALAVRAGPDCGSVLCRLTDVVSAARA